MVKRSQIRAFSAAVARAFHPEKILLFGSYAYGGYAEPSITSNRASDHLRVTVGRHGFLTQRSNGLPCFFRPGRDSCCFRWRPTVEPVGYYHQVPAGPKRISEQYAFSKIRI
jgi:hypothetical protein